MEREFLYVFGYESNEDARANARANGDTESTGVFRILAETEEAAAEWGSELAQWYLCQLRGNKSFSWKEQGFSAWIEKKPDENLTRFAESLPLVRVGDYPAFERIVLAYRDK